jgi:hypothetical protein
MLMSGHDQLAPRGDQVRELVYFVLTQSGHSDRWSHHRRPLLARLVHACFCNIVRDRSKAATKC